MVFLNSIWLWGGLAFAGIAVPIIIHLLNRLHKRRMDWAAMELLRRALVLRARQVQLEDLIILVLRCLALILLALALARPTLKSESGKWFGANQRVGVVIAFDASYSMGHGRFNTRFERAVQNAKEILKTVSVGDPVSVVLMGSHPRILLRGVSYEEERFKRLLAEKVAILPERLNLEPNLEEIEALVQEIKTPVRECYLLTDAQAVTWGELSAKARDSIRHMASAANVFFVPVECDGEENLAVTSLEFTSGTLRKEGVARFTAQVRNEGRQAHDGATAVFEVNGESVGRQSLGRLDPGQTKAVSFLAGFDEPGNMRLRVGLSPDALKLDNSQYAAVTIPPSVRVLCVDGDPAKTRDKGETYYVSSALLLKDRGADRPMQAVTVSWQEMLQENLSGYNVIVLANVPDMPPEQVKKIFQFVRNGGGLIVFLGGKVEADLYNAMREGNETLLPAELQTPAQAGQADGEEGWAIAPVRSKDPLAGLVESMPPDLTDSLRIQRMFKVKPAGGSSVILDTTDKDLPLLIEKRMGAGSVLLFTTTADREWTTFPVHPLYPMLIQQAVTYMTGAAGRQEFTAGQQMFLPVSHQEVGGNVILRNPPGGESLVKLISREGQGVVAAAQAGEPGFYEIRASKDAQPLLAAVNIDAAESDVKIMSQPGIESQCKLLSLKLVFPAGALLSSIRESRIGRELWRMLLVLAIFVFILQGWLARWFARRVSRGETDVTDSVRRRDLAAARKA